ncbi:hypothetical protein MMH89_03890 [Candidatus Comchoanobacter bicostacola]|uniref:Uncharacterized protein n=1 Tax=Candidatus Comchoanobacter bicostacola TaxID=2919598 RepID=A0ABY5DJ35_9GAMM|nr:hypothetical protein [Candidatus Comchoanobacter bicostacola]UTC24359.1 hypothetical protein MMH89_03890 [Candidatus Comchoanobacter bicostacola]
MASKQGDSNIVNMLLDNFGYIELENKPVNKGLKGEINTGDLGNPAYFETGSGWMIAYYPPQGKDPAVVKMSRGLNEKAYVSNEVLSVQTLSSSIELVEFLKDKGWTNFKFKDGSPLATWSTWAYLSAVDNKLTGYKATKEDKRKLAQAMHLLKAPAESSVQAAEVENMGTLIEGGTSK